MFTDYFGQPLKAGDKIAYATGGASANLRTAEIAEIVPLIPHRDQTTQLMRADQADQSWPTRFTARGRGPDKMFVVKIALNKDRTRTGGPLPGTRTIHNVDTIIKAPEGV